MEELGSKYKKHNKIKAGDIFKTNEEYEVEVLEYKGARNVVIRFKDEFDHVTTVESGNLRKGTVKNPFGRSVVGIGYYGCGPYKAKVKGKVERAYNKWKAMFVRCYCPKELAKHPTYKGVEVCEEWHNYQVFAEWYYKQPNHDTKGFDLDKDLLVLGGRIYAPRFCSFVPSNINKILTDSGRSRGVYPQGVSTHRDGKYYANLQVNNKQNYLGRYDTPEEAHFVYKDAKIKYVRQEAEKHRDYLHPQVYENLMNWKLEDLEKE